MTLSSWPNPERCTSFTGRKRIRTVALAKGTGGWAGVNLRTTFEKLVRRAGLLQWPRLFHNMRASCETDLMRDHSIHVVTAWIGNTPRIALGHYLQTNEADFEKALRGGADSGAPATQNRAQTQADAVCPEKTNATGSLEIPASRRVVSASGR